MTRRNTPPPAPTSEASEQPAKPAENPANSAARRGKEAAPTVRRKELVEQLRREVGGLRLSCREMLQAYEVRIGALLSSVEEALDAASGEKRVRTGQIEAALAALHTLRLQPEKGRAKDFKRLLQLAEVLVEQLEERA
jgi:hypothetical protein